MSDATAKAVSIIQKAGQVFSFDSRVRMTHDGQRK